MRQTLKYGHSTYTSTVQTYKHICTVDNEACTYACKMYVHVHNNYCMQKCIQRNLLCVCLCVHACVCGCVCACECACMCLCGVHACVCVWFCACAIECFHSPSCVVELSYKRRRITMRHTPHRYILVQTESEGARLSSPSLKRSTYYNNIKIHTHIHGQYTLLQYICLPIVDSTRIDTSFLE